MNAYVLIIIADVLLTMTLITQKQYQKMSGTSLNAGLLYNALMGFFSMGMFLIINHFQINLLPFSMLMATLYTIILVLYIFIGFKVMEKGNMCLYTLFLMSGGMIVPYVFGVFCLKEELTLARILGLFLILVAIIVSNMSGKKTDIKHLILCFAVFFLNGINCIISKVHQISNASRIVTASDFAFIVMVVKAIVCTAIIFVKRKTNTSKQQMELPSKTIIVIVLISAITDGVSYMLQLVVATTLPATILYPFVTGGSIVLTALAGAVVFREKLLVKQWISVAICFVGTLMFL